MKQIKPFNKRKKKMEIMDVGVHTATVSSVCRLA